MSKKTRRLTSREIEQLTEHLAHATDLSAQKFKVSRDYCMAILMSIYASAGDDDAIDRMQGFLNVLNAVAIEGEIEKHTAALASPLHPQRRK